MPSNFIGRFDNSMLEEITEFEKRYFKTWLWIKFKDGTWHLCNLIAIDGTTIYFNNSELGEIVLKANTEHEIEVRWPECRFFDYNNTIYWCYKLPDRQWKRAPCTKNFIFQRSLDILFTNRKFFDFSERLLKAAFEPTTPTSIIKIINSFKKSELSARAHTNNFAVSLPPLREKYFLLWYKNKPIAEIYPNIKTIIVKYTYLKQEVEDFNRDYENNQWNIQ